MAADGLVQEIKLRTDLVELISAYVPLKRSGRTHSGLCPFHSEKTPSFVVDGERGFFKCYGCGKGGDCFTFLQEKEGLAFPEAAERLARRCGLEWVQTGVSPEQRSQRERLHDVVALAARFFQQRLDQTPGVAEYLARRGVLPETMREFGLGYAPDDYEGLLRWLRGQSVTLEEGEAADLVVRTERGVRDRFVDRLIFPIFDLERRPVAFGGRTLRAEGQPKYLNSRETAIFSKGRTLYGLHTAKAAIPQAGFTVVVEGYMDLIALHQAGVENAVATLGTALTDTHVSMLRRYAQELVICYDGDSAGMRSAEQNSARFEEAGCRVRVARLPAGADPDTYLQEHGVEGFRSLLNHAEPLLDYQLNMLRRKYDLADERARYPYVREAVAIIRSRGSMVTRQEYASRLTRSLERLAEEWYPGDPHRALEAQTALRQEVSRGLRDGNARQGNGPPPLVTHSVGVTTRVGDFGPPPRRPVGRDGGRRGERAGRPGGWGTRVPVSPAAAAAGGSTATAERYVVRAAFAEPYWAAWIVEELALEHFSEPELRPLVELLLADDGRDAGARAEEIRQDPANAALLSRLLMVEEPLSEEGLASCVAALHRNRQQRRLQELQQQQLAGQLHSGDPEAAELRELLAGMGGSQRRED